MILELADNALHEMALNNYVEMKMYSESKSRKLYDSNDLNDLD